MKNVKKLFVVLPLVLVMLLSVVPVLAFEAGDPAPAAPFDDEHELNWFADQGDQELLWRVAEKNYDNGIFQTVVDQTSFSDADRLHWLHTDAYEMPIWVGENKPFATNGFIKLSDGRTKIVLLNGGGVHGWVTYNPEVVAPLAIAQNYVANNLPDYNIPEYQILNVLHVQKQVMVPETWLRHSEQPSELQSSLKDIKAQNDWGATVFDQDVVYMNAGELKEATQFWNEIGQPQATANAAGTMVVNYNGYEYKVMAVWATVDDQNVATEVQPDEDGNLPEGAKSFIKALEPIFDAHKNDAVPAALLNAGTIDWRPVLDGQVAYGILTVGQDKYAVRADNQVSYTGTVESKWVNVADPTKLVPAYVHGLMIIVEKSALPVEVTHHFQFADGTEVVEVTNETWAKANGELTVSKVMTDWYKTVPGFTIDVTKTTVAKVEDDTTLLIGEKVLKSYKVNLYYTAAEGADADQVDAAFAGNNANVAAAQQLPATGAADSFALVLSSLALAVVGFFLKK